MTLPRRSLQLIDEESFLPLLFSSMAGLSTCLGAAVVFFCSKQDGMSHNHMAFSLSLAGSVMVTVSVASLIPESFKNVDDEDWTTTNSKSTQRIISLLIGCVLYTLLSKCAFPEPEELIAKNVAVPLLRDTSQSELSRQDSSTDKQKSNQSYRKRKSGLPQPSFDDEELAVDHVEDIEKKKAEPSTLRRIMTYFSGSDLAGSAEAHRAWRVAMLLFISLAAHNFPEGLAVAASTLHSQHLGITTSIAIALHNIPEGIAIAIPCLAARPDSPCLAFALASLSGLAEPLGAMVALFVLRSSEKDSMVDTENLLAFVAGIMIMVAVQELFPEARRHCKTGYGAFISGTLIGIVVMVASDAVLEG